MNDKILFFLYVARGSLQLQNQRQPVCQCKCDNSHITHIKIKNKISIDKIMKLKINMFILRERNSPKIKLPVHNI